MVLKKYIKLIVNGETKVDVPADYMARHFAHHPEWMNEKEELVIYERDEEE